MSNYLQIDEVCARVEALERERAAACASHCPDDCQTCAVTWAQDYPDDAEELAELVALLV